MKIVYDQNGGVRKALVLALIGVGLAAAQGYLFTRAQRAGGDIDFNRQVRMRFWHAVKQAADAQSEAWSRLSATAATQYNRERI